MTPEQVDSLVSRGAPPERLTNRLTTQAPIRCPSKGGAELDPREPRGQARQKLSPAILVTKKPQALWAQALLYALLILATTGCVSHKHALAGGIGQPPGPRGPQSREELDLPVSELGMVGPPEGDCDYNGIPDSLDLLNQYAEDLNNNGEIDTCEPIHVPGTFDNRNAAWETRAREVDTLALFRTFEPAVGYAIECYVPIGSTPARLIVRKRSGEELAAINDCVSPGPHELFWALRNSHGLLVERNVEYVLCLELAGRSVKRRLRWDREFRF